MRRIAIIPARGGSKRIPRKNIRLFHGKPMITYAIESAKQSALFDTIFVSTDSEEIAAIARGAGAEVPFLRPPELADDQTLIAPVMRHALDSWSARKQKFDLACCIFATAPLIDSDDIKNGLREMELAGAPAAFTVGNFSPNPLRSLHLNADGSLSPMWPENENRPSNHLEKLFFDAGQFYWLRVDHFLKENRIWLPGARPLVLPWWKARDIDTLEDWEFAETLFTQRMLITRKNTTS